MVLRRTIALLESTNPIVNCFSHQPAGRRSYIAVEQYPVRVIVLNMIRSMALVNNFPLAINTIAIAVNQADIGIPLQVIDLFFELVERPVVIAVEYCDVLALRPFQPQVDGRGLPAVAMARMSQQFQLSPVGLDLLEGSKTDPNRL